MTDNMHTVKPHADILVLGNVYICLSVSLSTHPFLALIHQNAFNAAQADTAVMVAVLTVTRFRNTGVTFCACCSALMRRQRPETHTISESTLPRGCIDRGRTSGPLTHPSSPSSRLAGLV